MRKILLALAALSGIGLLSASAKTCTWTNATGDYCWDTSGNWDGGLPGESDVAKFTEVGLESGESILLAQDVTVSNLEISTSFVFKFAPVADATPVLAVGGVKTDCTGAKANVYVDVNVPVRLRAMLGPEPLEVPPAETNCEWNVTGWPGISLNKAVSKELNDVKLYKTGSGELRLNYAEMKLADAVVVRQGVLNANAKHSIQGIFVVGGGDESAQLKTVKEAFYSPSYVRNEFATPYVYTNGYVSIFADGTQYAPNDYHVYEGGRIYEYGVRSCKFVLQGSRIWGGKFTKGGSGQGITALESDQMSVFDAEMDIVQSTQNMAINVEDGPRAVDLLVTQRFCGFDDWRSDKNKNFKKNREGTLMTLADMASSLAIPVYVAAGRWIVDNPTCRGLGGKACYVQTGAILSGTGFLGGTADSANANVSVEGKASGLAILAPGSFSTNDNSRIFGRLTVGSEDQANSVSFKNQSRLEIGLGLHGQHDSLYVYGPVTVSQQSGHVTELRVTLPFGWEKTKGGQYEILTATEGISGPFKTVTCVDADGNPEPRVKVTYSDDMKSVYATVAGKGLTIIVR